MDFNKTLKITNVKPKRLKAIEDFLDIGLIGDGIVLAGGALRTLIDQNEKISDYDIFFVTENILELRKLKDKAESLLLKKGGVKIFQCPKDELRSYRLDGMKIQLISLNQRLYPSVESVINSFDINASRIGYDGKTFFVSPTAIKDITAKSISLNEIPFPLATAKRIARFGQKGYSNTKAFEQLLQFAYDAGAGGLDIDLEIVYVD